MHSLRWKQSPGSNTKRVFIVWTRLWSCVWVLTQRSLHMLQVRNQAEKKEEWLLVYTCASSRNPLGSCTNTLDCYPSIGARGCFHTYITPLRQCADFICKYTDGGERVRCLGGVMVGTLELHSLSALETDINTHLFLGICEKQDVFYSFFFLLY